MRAFRLSPLRRLEQFLVDDRQSRGFGTFPVVRRIWTRHAAASVGILDHPNPVPNDNARIQFVENDPVMALFVPVDCRGRPIPAARRLHAFLVQSVGNFARSFSADIVLKYPANDCGLAFDDLQFTRLASYGPIAVGPSAGMASVPHDALHPTSNLMSEIGQKERSEEASHANLDLIRRSLVHGPQFDAQKIEPFPNSGKVFLVSGDAIQRFDQNDFKFAVAGGVKKTQQSVATIDRSARTRSIIIDANDFQFIAFGVVSAYRHLVFDRTFVL